MSDGIDVDRSGTRTLRQIRGTGSLLYSISLSFSLQFFGVIVSWLYITRVEDAISEYGHYMDGLLNSNAYERQAKRQGRVSKWFKCMPEIDWWKDEKPKSSSSQQAVYQITLVESDTAAVTVGSFITPGLLHADFTVDKKNCFLGRRFQKIVWFQKPDYWVWYSGVNIHCVHAWVGSLFLAALSRKSQGYKQEL